MRQADSVSRGVLLVQSDSTGDLELLGVQSHAVEVDQQVVTVMAVGALRGR